MNCHKKFKTIIKGITKNIDMWLEKETHFLQVVLKVLVNCFDFCSVVVEKRGPYTSDS